MSNKDVLNQPVSQTASANDSASPPTPTDRRTRAINRWLFALGGVLVFGFACLKCREDLASGGSRSAPADAPKTMARDALACGRRDDMERVLSMLNDRPALEAFGAANPGVCMTLASGTEVVITDTAVMSGLVKVRAEGQIVEFWVSLDAVR